MMIEKMIRERLTEQGHSGTDINRMFAAYRMIDRLGTQISLELRKRHASQMQRHNYEGRN